MCKTLKEFVQTSAGFFRHALQWAHLQYNDQVILLNDNNSFIKKNKSLDGHGVAVYFVHGTVDHSCAFAYIAYKLGTSGLDKDVVSLHLVAFEGRYSGRSIDDFASQLLKKIKKNKHKRIILCGHSRGALVCAWFNQNLARKNNISVLHCISVCGPFGGSHLAIPPCTWFSKSISQMKKKSQFLKILSDKITTKPNSPYTFITGGWDYVVPKTSGYVWEYVKKYPSSLKIIKTQGHVSIMLSEGLRRHLQKIINNPVNSSGIELVVSKMN